MTKLLKSETVFERTGLSRSALHRLVQRGEFPRPTKIIGNVNGWPENEVSDWIAARIAEREAA